LKISELSERKLPSWISGRGPKERPRKAPNQPVPDVTPPLAIQAGAAVADRIEIGENVQIERLPRPDLWTAARQAASVFPATGRVQTTLIGEVGALADIDRSTSSGIRKLMSE